MNRYKAKVNIILLNYNGYEDTIECIKSINNITYENYKIVLVDNNSTDGSQEKLDNYVKDHNYIHYIKSKENLGFSGGNNLAINWSLQNGVDYICLLNNDTTVEPDFLNSLVEEMEKDNNIGISAGKIMYFDEKDIIWSAGGYISDTRGMGCHYGYNAEEKEEFDIDRDVTFLTGCIQLIRSSIFNDVGLYDEDYFLYMEDVDFCRKVIEAGYRLRYVPSSKIYHKVSASTGGEKSPLQLYYMTRNRVIFIRKHYNKLDSMKFYLFLLIKMMIEPFREKSKYKYMLKGLIDSLKGIDGEKDISSI